VKNHPWIRNFPWKKLYNKELEAPFMAVIHFETAFNLT